MIYYSDLVDIINAWAHDLKDVSYVKHDMELVSDSFTIYFKNDKELKVGVTAVTAYLNEVWINESSNVFCTIHSNSNIRNYFTYNSFGFNSYIFMTLRKFIKDFHMKSERNKIVNAIEDGIKEWLSHLNNSFLHEREEVKGVTKAYDGIKYTIYKVEPTQATRFYLTIGHTSTIDLFLNDKSIFYCTLYDDGSIIPIGMPSNVSLSFMTTDEIKLLVDYVMKHVECLTKKPEPKISTMDSSDTDLLKHYADEKAKKEKEYRDLTQFIEDLKELPAEDVSKILGIIPIDNILEKNGCKGTNAVIRSLQPVFECWLIQLVHDEQCPVESYELIEEETNKRVWKIRLTNDLVAPIKIILFIPCGFRDLAVVSVNDMNNKIMRIGNNDILLLDKLTSINYDYPIRINLLHNILYEAFDIKERRREIKQIKEIIINSINNWNSYRSLPDSNWIYVIKSNSVTTSIPPEILKFDTANRVGVLKIGFNLGQSFKAQIWVDTNEEKPIIRFDHYWQPIFDDKMPQGRLDPAFIIHLYHDLLRSYSKQNTMTEDPKIISDSMAKEIKNYIQPVTKIPEFKFNGEPEVIWLDSMTDITMKVEKSRKGVEGMNIPAIKHVLFNETKKVTTILFMDGTRVTSKASDDEAFDPEVGFAMAIMKKVYGTRSEFQRQIKKYSDAGKRRNSIIANKAERKKKQDEAVVPSVPKKTTRKKSIK